MAFRLVLAGLDGSRESLAAADWAAREALRRGLPLRLVHAWEAPPGLKAPQYAQRHGPAHRTLPAGLGAHTGPVAHAVIRHAAYPIAVVPHE